MYEETLGKTPITFVSHKALIFVFWSFWSTNFPPKGLKGLTFRVIMSTGSFTYKNVIKDDSTAERLGAALLASASVPLPRATLIPDVEGFLHTKANPFEKSDFGRTYLICDTDASCLKTTVRKKYRQRNIICLYFSLIQASTGERNFIARHSSHFFISEKKAAQFPIKAVPALKSKGQGFSYRRIGIH